MNLYTLLFFIGIPLALLLINIDIYRLGKRYGLRLAPMATGVFTIALFSVLSLLLFLGSYNLPGWNFANIRLYNFAAVGIAFIITLVLYKFRLRPKDQDLKTAQDMSVSTKKSPLGIIFDVILGIFMSIILVMTSPINPFALFALIPVIVALLIIPGIAIVNSRKAIAKRIRELKAPTTAK